MSENFQTQFKIVKIPKSSPQYVMWFDEKTSHATVSFRTKGDI